jgi:ribonuclease HI
LVTDASGFAAGAIVYQRKRVTAIWSRALTKAERNYTANERELLAVVDALQDMHYLFEVSPLITVHTDNMINVANIQSQCTNKRVNRWVERLMVYQLTWQHIPGADNPADAVSRNPSHRILKD